MRGSRRSAKAEIKSRLAWIMMNRPQDNSRIVIELVLIRSIARSMEWESVVRSIDNFLERLNTEVVLRGMNEGVVNVESSHL